MEDVDRLEIAIGLVLLIVIVNVSAALAGHRRQNHDALLAFADVAIGLLPGLEASDKLGLRLLAPNQHAISEAVFVETATKGEVLPEAVAIPHGLDTGFYLLHCDACCL